MIRLLMAAVTATLLAASPPLRAEEKYAGYYHPEITSQERFTRVVRDAGDANRAVRLQFVTDLTAAQMAAPESPRFVFFAKGEDARHLFLLALDDDIFSTLYRARAVLAQLTSNMRRTDVVDAAALAGVNTFFDLLQILEFDTLVISDGKRWAHKVNFVRN